VSETGLNDSANFNGTLQGGGGISSVYSFPWYQKGVSGVSTSGRNIPDVSFPGEFVAVYQATPVKTALFELASHSLNR
jgi:subtilase family serine protease